MNLPVAISANQSALPGSGGPAVQAADSPVIGPFARLVDTSIADQLLQLIDSEAAPVRVPEGGYSPSPGQAIIDPNLPAGDSGAENLLAADIGESAAVDSSTSTLSDQTPPSTDFIASGSETTPTTDLIASGSETTPTTDLIASGSETTPTTDLIASGSETTPTTDLIVSGSETTPTDETSAILPGLSVPANETVPPISPLHAVGRPAVTRTENPGTRASHIAGQDPARPAATAALNTAATAPRSDDGEIASQEPRAAAPVRPGGGAQRNGETSGKAGTTRPVQQPLQTPIVATIANPVTGQTVVHIYEPAETGTNGLASIGSGVTGVQVRAVSPPPAHQGPQVPLNALAVHIAQQSQNGIKRFDIRLDPPELGRLEIRLNVTRDGHVTTHMVVERAETLDLLQRDARSLERALQNAGLDTSEGSLKFSLRDQGLAQDTHDQHGGSGTNGGKEAESDDFALENGGTLPVGQHYLAADGLDIRI